MVPHVVSVTVDAPPVTSPVKKPVALTVPVTAGRRVVSPPEKIRDVVMVNCEPDCTTVIVAVIVPMATPSMVRVRGPL